MVEWQRDPWVKFGEMGEEEVSEEGQGKMIRHHVYKTGNNICIYFSITVNGVLSFQDMLLGVPEIQKVLVRYPLFGSFLVRILPKNVQPSTQTFGNRL